MATELVRPPSERLARILPPIVTLDTTRPLTLRAAAPVFLRCLVYTYGRAPMTALCYGGDLADFIGYCEGQGLTAPSEVRTDTIEAWLARRRQEVRKSSSVRRNLYAVRSFFRYLVHQEIIDRDPARVAHGPKVVRPVPVYASPDRQDWALTQIAEDRSLAGRRDHAVIGMFLYTGLRCAELAMLRLHDLDLRGDASLVRVSGKGQRERIVPVVPPLQVILREYLRDVRPVLLKGDTSPWVFVRAGHPGFHGSTVVTWRRRHAGRPLGTRTIWAIITRRLRPLLGPNVSPQQVTPLVRGAHEARRFKRSFPGSAAGAASRELTARVDHPAASRD